MKKTISPKTKTFFLSTASFVTLLSVFSTFHQKKHGVAFKELIMSNPAYKACVSLSNFKPRYPVSRVEIILYYD